MFSLTGQFWKIATGGAAVVSLILATMLLSSYFDNRELTNQRNELALQINDPQNGYIAQVTRLRQDNAEQAQRLDEQSEAIAKLSKESQERLVKAQAELAFALREQRRLEAKLSGFLATGPQGGSLEERVRDIDERALRELLK